MTARPCRQCIVPTAHGAARDHRALFWTVRPGSGVRTPSSMQLMQHSVNALLGGLGYSLMTLTLKLSM